MRVEQDFWTATMVKARLEEAADSLRRIRAARYTLPAGYVGAWPDVVQDTWDAYGLYEPRTKTAIPSARAIDRMDESIAWITRIGGEDEVRRLIERHHHAPVQAEDAVIARRKIVWARACRIPWRRLEDMDGRSHTTLRKVQAEGFEAILRWLNRSRGDEADRVFGKNERA